MPRKRGDDRHAGRREGNQDQSDDCGQGGSLARAWLAQVRHREREEQRRECGVETESVRILEHASEDGSEAVLPTQST